jgi:hypothetical protein
MAFLRPPSPSALWPTSFLPFLPLTYPSSSKRQRYSGTSSAPRLPLAPSRPPRSDGLALFPSLPHFPCARAGSLVLACAVSEWGVTPTVAPRGLGGYASLISWSPFVLSLYSLSGLCFCGPARVAKSPIAQTKIYTSSSFKYQSTFPIPWPNLDDPSSFQYRIKRRGVAHDYLGCIYMFPWCLLERSLAGYISRVLCSYFVSILILEKSARSQIRTNVARVKFVDW